MRTNMRFGSVAVAIAVAAVVSGGLMVQTRKACAQQQKTSFAEDVMPIFKGRCMDCHRPGGAGYDKSGLELSTYEGLMKGRNSDDGDPRRRREQQPHVAAGLACVCGAAHGSRSGEEF